MRRGKRTAEGQKYACVILAGGLGTRMRSALPKVLHPVCGRPMIEYALDAALALKPRQTVVVTGRQTHGPIEKALATYARGADVRFAPQVKPLGTGHALQTAMKALGDGFGGSVVVLNGDFPLIRPQTLKKLLRLHLRNKNALTLGSFITEHPG